MENPTIKREERPDSHQPGVGTRRGKLYRACFSQINKAKEAGCWLEVITLCESLISDRMESIINELSGNKVGFNTAGELAFYYKENYLFGSVNIRMAIKEVAPWMRKRNNALHQMAKLDSNLETTFETRYNRLPAIAEEGIQLFRKLDKAIADYRKDKKNRLAKLT